MNDSVESWSLSLTLILSVPLYAGVAWWFCFHVLFPRWLDPRRPQPPWPRDAFGRALALVWLLSCALAPITLALLWRRSAADYLASLAAGILAGIPGAVFIRVLVRHRQPTDRPKEVSRDR
jgi:hypothetical protein